MRRLSFAATVAFLAALCAAHSSHPRCDVQRVLTPGVGGYAAYRIPGMATYVSPRLGNASVAIAVAEGRKYGCDDLAGQHDLVMARSVDGGRTWLHTDPPVVVVDAATGIDPTLGSNRSAVWDPTPVYDPVTGVVHVLFAWGATPEARLHGHNYFFEVTSADDGVTWSAPRNLTSVTAPHGWPGLTAGNGNGIAMQGGRYAGRLVVPMYGHVDATIGTGTRVLVSDDHGATWVLEGGCCHDTAEPEVAQLWANPNALYACLRSTARHMDCGAGPGAPTHCRQTAHSPDGGDTWENFTNVDSIPDPNNKGAVHRLPSLRGLTYSNTRSDTRRVNQTVYLSLDDGRSWPWRVHVPVAQGGYSTLGVVYRPDTTLSSAVNGTEHVGLLFEIDTCTIGFASFPPELFFEGRT